MECDVCEQPGRRKFFCEVCLKERLLIHRSSLKRLGENHEATVKRALPILEAPDGVQERRIAKARRAKLLSDCLSLESKDKQVTDSLHQSQTIVAAKTTQLSIRRDRLKQAREQLESRRNPTKFSTQQRPYIPGATQSTFSATHLIELRQQILITEQHWGEVIKNLIVVRRSLISQLLTIYPITSHRTLEVPQEPQTQRSQPSNRNQLQDATSPPVRSEWRISGLCLPTFTEVKFYSREEVSAAALFTAHFLRLTAMYLGVKLPFQLSMGPVLSISAPRHSVWKSDFPALYPLHLPIGPNYLTSSSSTRSSSYVAFLTGLSMLAYNTYYLFDSQRPSSLTSQSGVCQRSHPHKAREVLQSLYACCHSLELGNASHVTGKEVLKRPGSPSELIDIDLSQIVNEALQIKSEDVVEEDWSLI
ncbi:UV radiation resistance protein and autophagy-related subunit 14-domain-containing protein [Melampsora americana]|nr:UV radiation resistance protein and autophagy-related subunit 14-domain-containing protein [Melampsora americana]